MTRQSTVDYEVADLNDELLLEMRVGAMVSKCKHCGKVGPASKDWEQLHNCVPFDPAGEEKKK